MYATENRYILYKSALYTPFLLHWTISPPLPLTLSPSLPLSPSLRNKEIIETDLVLRGS